MRPRTTRWFEPFAPSRDSELALPGRATRRLTSLARGHPRRIMRACITGRFTLLLCFGRVRAQPALRPELGKPQPKRNARSVVLTEEGERALM